MLLNGTNGKRPRRIVELPSPPQRGANEEVVTPGEPRPAGALIVAERARIEQRLFKMRLPLNGQTA